MTHKPFIQIKNLNKNYHTNDQTTAVLKSVSVDIHTQELIAIVGASGSGKSTLLNILGLLDSACGGEYWLQEQLITAYDENTLADLRNRYFGFVFQQFHLLARMTAWQNVALPLTYRNLSPTQLEENVMSALAKVGMADYYQRLPTQLSGGQQQRVAIARALVTQPQVILADEPTGALDSRTGQEVMDLFLALHTEGRTIILVTHDLKLAKHCPRQLMMADGQIIQEHTAL